ncbi:MAG: PAS domain-containing sensor histidine kinase, partial [Alphaproteobacteria bacterium]|nr:PAS domain-containing sensor histidine kinase [Alphaproteobacteria bacterium]
SKIESGKVDLDEQEIDIAGLVTSVIRIMESRAFKSEVKLTIDIEDKIPTLIADMRLIRQVLINLVSNAVKFSKKGQEIKTKVFVDELGDLILSVEDHGIGIPKDKIKDALEPFGQIMDSQHAKEQQGTGLGLPLARAMVELHGGHLELESDVGKGTIVTITLPSRRIKMKPDD